MKCAQCHLEDSIDCIVYLPGKLTCSRCGQKMNSEQVAEARDFYPWGKEIPEDFCCAE